MTAAQREVVLPFQTACPSSYSNYFLSSGTGSQPPWMFDSVIDMLYYLQLTISSVFLVYHVSGCHWDLCPSFLCSILHILSLPQLLALTWPQPSLGSTSLPLSPPFLLRFWDSVIPQFPIPLAIHWSDEMRRMLILIFQVYNCCF